MLEAIYLQQNRFFQPRLLKSARAWCRSNLRLRARGYTNLVVHIGTQHNLHTTIATTEIENFVQ